MTGEADPITEALERCAALPLEAVMKLFDKYGHPLEDPGPLLDPVVALGDGHSRVGRLRFRSPVDVIANDYFVLERRGAPPFAMPGPLFAGAIAALSRPR